MKKVLVTLFLLIGSYVLGQSGVIVTNLSKYWNDDDPTCTIKSRVAIQNNTKRTISSVTFWLIVLEDGEEGDDDRIVYKRKHTVNYIIKPEEVVPSPIFTWNCCNAANYGNSPENYKIYVISYR